MTLYQPFRTRGYLPHLDNAEVLQFVTFGLSTETTFRLTDPRLANIVRSALLHFDGQRYELQAWAIMPDHVHVLVRVYSPYTLPDILKSWKSFTARAMNQVVGGTGRVWRRESFDRYIRDEPHRLQTLDYILENPVAAGLVARREDWPWSSAYVP